MKKYIVNCQNYCFFECFTIEANNYAEAVELGRRQCRLEGIRFLSVRLKK